MASASDWLSYAPVEIAIRATLFAICTISVLVLFIWIRRTYRSRYFARRDVRAGYFRQHWSGIVSLEIPPAAWINETLDRELVESMLLESLDTATEEQLPELIRCVRSSGLLERYLLQARTWRGWKRQRALITLGRTRAPEAIVVLAEALNSPNVADVTTAVSALGHLGVPDAAVPILERMSSSFDAPRVPLKQALVHCCRTEPALLVRYLSKVEPQFRELVAQALALIATPEIADQLTVLASDPAPEIRASAARALAKTDSRLAIRTLSILSEDAAWFVRLRAVASLGKAKDPETIDALVRRLCDENRIVRQRAASALLGFEEFAPVVMRKVLATNDKYALHAYVSELQRTGTYAGALEHLKSNQHGGSKLVAAMEVARGELRLKAPEATR